jgi:hypothetical protein
MKGDGIVQSYTCPRSGASGHRRLHVIMNPSRDREEYAALSGILAAGEKGRAAISGLDAVVSSDSPDIRRLGSRAASLGVLDWSIGASRP